MKDYLKILQKVCAKYKDLGGYSCEGCPFNFSPRNDKNCELDCDSGYYNKAEWDIDLIKELLDKEEE